MGALPAHVSVHDVHVVHTGQKRALDPLGLELGCIM